MKHFQDHLLLRHHTLRVYSLHSCFENTTKSLVILASRIAQEISTILNSLLSKSLSIHHISFIGHSIGSLVLRLAFNNPLLSPFTKYFHLFLSLNAPHVGVLFARKPLEWGSKVLSLVGSSALVDELLLKDAKNPRNALLYRMALNHGGKELGQLCVGLSQFKYFYLVSSCQDAFVPFHSERVETTPSILETESEEADAYQEMVTAFWREFRREENKTVIKKFDVCYDVREVEVREG